MPQTQVHNVCIPCRNIMPQYFRVEKSPGSETYDLICKACGGLLARPPYKWSPPKKTNDRAWKRIANGEWLWDRRRTRRGWKNHDYTPWYRVRVPGHKKGQPETLMGGFRGKNNAELGG